MKAAASTVSPATPDLEVAERFLTLLAEGEPSVTFQTFDDDGDRKQETLQRKLHGELQDFADLLHGLNSKGAGIYVMLNEGDLKGRSAENVIRVRAVFADLDGAPLEPVLSAPLEPHIITNTSPDRWHGYWLVEGFELEDFEPVQHAIAARFHSDVSVSDLCRVVRLPGFYKMKPDVVADGGHQVTILAENPVLPYSKDQFLEAFGFDLSKPAPEGTSSSSSTPSHDDIWSGIPEGERNNRIFKKACSLRAKGLPFAEAKILISALAESCNPSLSEQEAWATLKSAYRYQSKHSLNDLGNARRLKTLEGEDIRFVPEFKKFLIWKDGRWNEDGDGEIFRRAKSIIPTIEAEAANVKIPVDAEPEKKAELRKHRQALASHAKATGNATKIKAMVDMLSTEPGIPVHQNKLDADPFLFGVRNGVVDLCTGALRSPNRADMITKVGQVEFVPGASCPTWLGFMHRIMGGNQGLIRYLQRLVGYALTGITVEHMLAFLHGRGANGKTTFTAPIQTLLGDYCKQAPADSLMVKRGETASNDVARLRGSRLALATETEDGKRLAESLIKQMTGGDVVTARFLYAEFFEFRPTFKLWLVGNHKPNVTGDDYGIWRRLHLIPFTETIPPAEQDKALPEKLLEELPGILNWAIEGCREWQQGGLQPPEEVRAATDEYKSEMDLIGAWLEECCEIGPKYTARSADLYRSFHLWAEDNNEWRMSQTKFGRKLKERFRKDHTRKGSEYRGVDLTKEARIRVAL